VTHSPIVAGMSRTVVEEPTLADVLTELRLLVAEVRGIRADLNQRRDAPDLVAEIRDEFGEGRFTARGLLDLASEAPALGQALAAAVDPDASPRSRSTALGRLLARLPAVEVVAEQRGVAVYRLRT
jgi:hypothetical protein